MIKIEIKEEKSFTRQSRTTFINKAIRNKKPTEKEGYPMPRTRTAVFIEMSNINAGFRRFLSDSGTDLRTRMDINELIRQVTNGSELVSKSVYLETRPDSDQIGQAKFHNYLKGNDFRIVSKEIKTINQIDGSTKNKADFDVEITVDICASAWRRDCDEVVLCSGDSDYAYLIRMLKSFGISVTVVAFRKSLSKELREEADKLIIIEENINMDSITFLKVA